MVNEEGSKLVKIVRDLNRRNEESNRRTEKLLGHTVEIGNMFTEYIEETMISLEGKII